MLDTQTTQTKIWSNGHSWVTLVVILLFINSKYKTKEVLPDHSIFSSTPQQSYEMEDAADF